MFFAPATKAQSRAQTRAQNRVVTIPAPVGGLNARDSIATMPETDALIMRNLWPQPYGCLVKKGSKEFAIGMPGDVTTLAAWSSLTGSAKLFAWSGPSMYDITTGGVVGATLITGLSSARWETTAMSNSLLPFLTRHP